MSFEHLSANQPGLFAEPESASPSPAPRVKSARSANRAAWWEQDLSRTATYLMGQARNDEERAFVERLYDEATSFLKLRSERWKWVRQGGDIEKPMVVVPGTSSASGND